MALIEPPLALYLHFPWCVHKCPYCDFNSHTLHGELPEHAYLDALRADLDAQLPHLNHRTITSVFLGGGTPSLFSPDALGNLFASITARVKIAPDAEWTLEANPGTIERGRFSDYRAVGINRVSLGAQSFQAEQLVRLGRIHSAPDTRAAVAELHQSGLSNFNLDLMYALPGQDLAGALSDVRAAIELAPAHISHYQLTMEPGTVFGGRPPAGLPNDELSFDMQLHCQAELARAGYVQYEISAYARPGAQCIHNLNYWHFGDYLGVGAGAHGKLTQAASGTILRTVREREPRRYQSRGAATAATTTLVAAAERPFEFMMNALRLTDGFDSALFESRTGLAWSYLRPIIHRLENRGLLAQAPGCEHWGPTELGFRFLNDVIADFLPTVSAAQKNQAPKNVEAPVV